MLLDKYSPELGKEKGNNTKRIITTSPDVTVSTNLGNWVNQRDIFSRNVKRRFFQEKKSYFCSKMEIFSTRPTY